MTVPGSERSFRLFFLSNDGIGGQELPQPESSSEKPPPEENSEHELPEKKAGNRGVVVASSKQIAWEQFQEIVGAQLPGEVVAAFDPESLKLLGGEPPPEDYFEPEPTDPNPVTAVHFKLARALHELIEKGLQKYKPYRVTASDIAFSYNGIHTLKPIRSKEDRKNFNEEISKQELAKRYSQPFQAIWEAAFGIAEEGRVTTGVITIQAHFPALTREEIDQYFEPNANPGLELIELGINKDLDFFLTLAKDTEAIVCNTTPLRELIEQLVVKKVPTVEMFRALCAADMEQQPEEYGIFALALSHFLQSSESSEQDS